MAPDKIAQVIRDTPFSDKKKGCCAYFIRINNKWGMKYYFNMIEWLNTYKLQKIAWKVGAAPKVGKKFTIKTDGGETIYGYFTEAVTETYKERNIRQYNDSRRDPGCGRLEGYPELIEKIRDAGISLWDFHHNNVGWMPDGRLVAIDFSEEVWMGA